MCFIETKNLDGETNLKHKFVHKDLLNFYNNDLEVLYHFLKIISKLFSYAFTGSYEIETSEGKKQISLDHKNFILRGCSLRNTKYVIGLVSYTG